MGTTKENIANIMGKEKANEKGQQNENSKGDDCKHRYASFAFSWFFSGRFLLLLILC